MRRHEVEVAPEVFDHWRSVLVERWFYREIEYPFLVRAGDDVMMIDTGVDLVRRKVTQS